MADDRPSIPRWAAGRIASVGSYVRGYVEEQEARRPRGDEGVRTSDLQVMQALASMWALHRTLVDGSIAAERAVDACRGLGVKGFVVGAAVFEPGNDNVLRGRQLAAALMEQVPPDLRAGLLAHDGLREVTDWLYHSVRDGQAVG